MDDLLFAKALFAAVVRRKSFGLFLCLRAFIINAYGSLALLASLDD